MFGLLPFLFAIIILQSAGDISPQSTWMGPWPSFASVFGGSFFITLAICLGMTTLVARQRRHQWLRRWDFVAQALILGWFAWLCYGLGWTQAAGANTLCFLPFLALFMVHWWSMADAVRAVTGHHWTRSALLLHHLRFSAAPILLIVMALSDGAKWLYEHYALAEFFTGPFASVLVVIGSNALLIGGFLVVPAVLVRLWGARPLPAGPLRESLQQACASMGVKVNRLMRWPVRGGRMYNAAVVGVMPRFRYVLFTDDLLRDLDTKQLTAVLGHELGHARHGHLWLYLIFINVALAALPMLSEPLARMLAAVPGSGQLNAHIREGIVILAAFALLFRFVFGAISRACERQADLAGANLVGDYQTMQEALKTVALLSGQPENSPNWRHYSIAQRVEFLQRAKKNPDVAAEHHRLVGSMRFSLIVLLIVILLSAATEYLNPIGRAERTMAPEGDIAALADHDAALKEALARADDGDISELAKWANRASPLELEQLARLHMRLIENAGEDADRTIYRLRHRLRALINVPTGNALLDLELDNTLAYGLVAGTRHPNKQDIEQARLLLPRLELTQPNHAIADTIGCIQFAAVGDYARAEAEFLRALDLLGKETRNPDAARADSERLYRRRLEAAQANLRATGEHSGELVPLPLTWTDDSADARMPAIP